MRRSPCRPRSAVIPACPALKPPEPRSHNAAGVKTLPAYGRWDGSVAAAARVEFELSASEVAAMRTERQHKCQAEPSDYGQKAQLSRNISGGASPAASAPAS